MGPLPTHTHGEGYPTRIPSPLPISLTVPHSMYMQESTTKHSLIQVLLFCYFVIPLTKGLKTATKHPYNLLQLSSTLQMAHP